MIGLTKRQAEVLSFVQQFIDSHSYSPSLNEIKTHFGYASINTVAKQLAILKRKGHISKEPHSHRSVSIPKPMKMESSLIITLPLIGAIRAERPIETFAEIKSMHLPLALVPKAENAYLLKVQDNSLEEEMLIEGDLLIVEARNNPQPGETIVAQVNKHFTLIAKYFLDGEYIKLISHSSRVQPIILKKENISVHGIIIASFRHYSMHL